MSKQILVKAFKSELIKQMYEEAQKYLENIGFKKEPMISLTDGSLSYRCFVFSQGEEKVVIEYRRDQYEEAMKLLFIPLEIKFIYDILLMRFNQLSSQEKDSVFIQNE